MATHVEAAVALHYALFFEARAQEETVLVAGVDKVALLCFVRDQSGWLGESLR
jgi:hypothetical protein